MKTSTAFALMITALSVANPAAAAEITLDGYTNGCFYTGASCIPVSSDAPQSATLGELVFSSVDIAGTTVAGELPLTLGLFSLQPAGNDTYTGSDFNLRVSFDAPLGLGAPTSVLTSVLTGTTSSAPGQCRPAAAPCGSVLIDFDNNPIPFSFTSGNTTGSFFLTISDLTVFAGQTGVALAGRISGASQTVVITPNDPRQAPEPATLALFGAGLFALAAGVRRSRQR